MIAPFPGWGILQGLVVAALTGVGTWLLQKVKSMKAQREEDHKRISALWRMFAFGKWDGVERRSRVREDE